MSAACARPGWETAESSQAPNPSAPVSIAVRTFWRSHNGFECRSERADENADRTPSDGTPASPPPSVPDTTASVSSPTVVTGTSTTAPPR
ncbi:hypothetical protein [Streptomyces sp. 3N207]|uniref:hypothetical protein n=1 Tax=Streptomyces sp. 3N207 TaxID=3457417 RepID=UPI003FD2C60E